MAQLRVALEVVLHSGFADRQQESYKVTAKHRAYQDQHHSIGCQLKALHAMLFASNAHLGVCAVHDMLSA